MERCLAWGQIPRFQPTAGHPRVSASTDDSCLKTVVTAVPETAILYLYHFLHAHYLFKFKLGSAILDLLQKKSPQTLELKS